jgi:DNA-binding MarR family transcriptional regulator
VSKVTKSSIHDLVVGHKQLVALYSMLHAQLVHYPGSSSPQERNRMTAEERRVQWQALSSELARHARSLHMMKAQLTSQLPNDLDMATVGLLLHLSTNGPCRQGELAETAHLDPSTVSRHVAQLVRAGYAERAVHPDDGRVVQLQPTETGRALCVGFAEYRHTLIAQVMAHWPEEDVKQLTHLLARMNDDIDTLRPRTATGTRSTNPTSTRRTDG